MRDLLCAVGSDLIEPIDQLRHRRCLHWRLGGVQFDFARLETEPLNLFVRENSFEPEDFICQAAMVEHLKLRLFVGFADRGVQRPP